MKIYTCIAVDDSQVQLALLKNYIRQTEFLRLKELFSKPLAACEYLAKNKVDILFLDIEMPELSGLDLLRTLQNPPKTILITSRSEFALEAFDLDVVDYIVKPPEYPRFLKAISKAITLIEKKMLLEEVPQEQAIFVKSNGKLLRLETDSIDYLEAMSDYVVIHTEDKRSHIVYATLKEFEAKMKAFKNFYRIHRSYIIHLQKIKSIENGQVCIADKYLPIGNTYKEAFMNILGKV